MAWCNVPSREALQTSLRFSSGCYAVLCNSSVRVKRPFHASSGSSCIWLLSVKVQSFAWRPRLWIQRTSLLQIWQTQLASSQFLCCQDSVWTRITSDITVQFQSETSYHYWQPRAASYDIFCIGLKSTTSWVRTNNGLVDTLASYYFYSMITPLFFCKLVMAFQLALFWLGAKQQL